MFDDSETLLDTTVNEWRTEIERLERGDPGETIGELCKTLKMGRTSLQRKVSKLIKEGRCTEGRGVRYTPSGRLYPVAVYQLISEKKRSKE